MIRRRFNTWRRHQPSRVRYVLVPGHPRLAACGFIPTAVVVEINLGHLL